jgi:hypothetical protein
MLEQHGTPNAQKDELVEFILSTCQDPRKWPLTDAERIEFLKQTYERTRRIDQATNL